MKIATTLFLFVVVGCTWRETIGTCVLDSDFGFVLNCAFKKSGLFRVRNLGGIKGYVGLGFSVGDELGFQDSLTNKEALSKRRSVQAGRGNFIAINPFSNVATNRDGSRVVPPFKPLPPGGARPMAPQPERQRLVVQENSTALKTIPAPSLATIQEEALKQQQKMLQEEKMKQQHQKMQQEALAMQMLKQQRLQQQHQLQQKQLQQQQMQQQQQQNMQQQVLALQTKKVQVSQGSSNSAARLPTIVAAIPPAGSVVNDPSSKPVAGILIPNSALPPFIAMPKSSAQLTDRISHSPTLLEDSVNEVSKDEYKQLPIPGDDATAAVNQMTLLSLQNIAPEELQSMSEQTTGKRQSIPSSLAGTLPSLEPIQSMETSLKALAQASNITLEALEAAILMRQQQLLQKQQGPTTTTTSTTLPPPPKNNNYSGTTKVMNAPREYYPVGYDKNFDDNFASRVDLPDTSFYCGDQKHFPGLYADQDLGCMVFHVCALTDDGLIMKSFLCPESTLFDQTILKCNWWFYVDCKSSKSLYDSNIPISKSYQLMKALAFFSAYKNHDNSTLQATETEEAKNL